MPKTTNLTTESENIFDFRYHNGRIFASPALDHIMVKAFERYKRYIDNYPGLADNIAFVASDSVMAASAIFLPETLESLAKRALGLRNVSIYRIKTWTADIFFPAVIMSTLDNERFNFGLTSAMFSDGDLMVTENESRGNVFRLCQYSTNDRDRTYVSTGYLATKLANLARVTGQIFQESRHRIPRNVYKDIEDRINLSRMAADRVDPLSNEEITLSIDLSDLRNLIDRIFNDRMAAKPEKDELNPGNTDAIDNYLDSFSRGKLHSRTKEGNNENNQTKR